MTLFRKRSPRCEITSPIKRDRVRIEDDRSNMTALSDLREGLIVRGNIFAEPVKIITIIAIGTSIKLVGEGLKSGKVHHRS